MSLKRNNIMLAYNNHRPIILLHHNNITVIKQNTDAQQ